MDTEKKATTLTIEADDTALILRSNGKLETYLRRCKEKNEKPANNEIVVYVIANLLKDKQWIQDTVNLYNDRCKIAKESVQ